MAACHRAANWVMICRQRAVGSVLPSSKKQTNCCAASAGQGTPAEVKTSTARTADGRQVTRREMKESHMPKGYILAEISVPDPAAYRDSGYMAQAEAAIKAVGGRYLVRGGEPELEEGAGAPGRIVILEFSSRDAARAFLEGPEYAPARALRQSLSSARLMLLSGWDG